MKVIIIYVCRQYKTRVQCPPQSASSFLESSSRNLRRCSLTRQASQMTWKLYVADTQSSNVT